MWGERVIWAILESYKVLGAPEEASGPSGEWRSLPGGGDASPWPWGTPGSFLPSREGSHARPEALGVFRTLECGAWSEGEAGDEMCGGQEMDLRELPPG